MSKPKPGSDHVRETRRMTKRPRPMLYSCPICNVKIESLGSAMLWCRCLPETPTQMDDVAWSRSISNAVRPMIAGLKGRS